MLFYFMRIGKKIKLSTYRSGFNKPCLKYFAINKSTSYGVSRNILKTLKNWQLSFTNFYKDEHLTFYVIFIAMLLSK